MLFQRDRAGYTFLGILCGCLLLSDRVASTDVLCGQYQNVTDPSGEYTSPSSMCYILIRTN